MFYKSGFQSLVPAILITLSLAVGTAVHAQALEILNPPVKVKAAKKAAKKTAGNRAKFDSGSQETVKQREARLRRECQGATNAGACSGYTR